MFYAFIRYLRQLSASVFVKCVAAMAITTLIVSIVLTVHSSAITERVAKNAVVQVAEKTIISSAPGLVAPVRFRTLDKLNKALDRIMKSAGQSGVMAVIYDGEGSVLSSRGDGTQEEVAMISALAKSALEEGKVISAEGGLFLASPLIREEDEMPVGALAMIWSAEVSLKAVNAENQLARFYALITFLVMTVAMVILLRRLIARPLNRLGAAIAGVANGDYDSEVPLLERSDEFGSIAGRLDTLLIALRTAREAESQRQENSRSQSAVVDHLSGGLIALADGVLTHKISVAFPDEYEALRENYNKAVDSLQNAILEVRDSANSIRGGAEEINLASDELSRRTETQAANLEETAAALDELVASVKSAADGARQVDETVKTASSMTERSALVMKDAVAAMAVIEKSSEQIGEIIAVIDDIAFQTSLLALNAGVEAARAGDEGKGFAVIASEVRALSQSSSEAARQIKTLISGSTVQVKSGAQIMEQAGAALLEVVDQVGNISVLVSEIAQSAMGQSQSIQEINMNVANLDQVTQQNAAMVEQSAAAAQLLNEDSARLAEMVEKFSLSEKVQGQDVWHADSVKLVPGKMGHRAVRPSAPNFSNPAGPTALRSISR